MPYWLYLSGNRITGRGSEPRAGSRALTLLAKPLNGMILGQLLERPMRLAELRSDSGSAPQTTIRTHLRRLEDDGLTIKRSRESSPGVAEFALTSAGTDLLVVVAALEQWLELAPDGAMTFESAAGMSAIKALEGGWSSTMLAALTAEPLTLVDMAHDIAGVSYPSLSRQLVALRRAGHVESRPGTGQGAEYWVSEWLQQGVVPLAAAIRWERDHFAAESAPMVRLDITTAFLLALPLLRMALQLNGSCRMGVDIDDAEGRTCGAIAVVERGRVVSCIGTLENPVDSWASGSMPAWAQTLVAAGPRRLELGGDKELAGGVVGGLRGMLVEAESDGPDLSGT